VRPCAEEDFQAFGRAPEFESFFARGELLGHEDHGDRVPALVDPEEAKVLGPGRWIEHPRVPFVSYPGEWTFGMLKAAATLTLELGDAALSAGLELKDASPRNIVFRNGHPVFVDVLSFQRFSGTPVWRAYHQCVRSLVLPLYLARDLDLRLDRVFLCEREGLAIEEVGHLLGPWRRLCAPYRSLVTLPTWLARFSGRVNPPSLDPAIARKICRNRVRRLQRLVAACCRRQRTPSPWIHYGRDCSYDGSALDAKRQFTDQALSGLEPGAWVLDLGANTGEYSIAAAQRGLNVVAIDSDEPCMDQLFSQARERGLAILPMVMNLGNPTPPRGWQLAEESSFLERAAHRFDLVLALALVHHLRFSEGVTLQMQVDYFSRLTRRRLLLEWVEPEDPMARELMARHGLSAPDYCREALEGSLGEQFRTLAQLPLPGGTRRLYLLERRNAPA
jgi:SAM-dependent methyltransferase